VRALFPWLPLGLLFLAPFVDPRRPFRLLHLDLLVLVGFSSIYLAWFEHPVGDAVFVAGAFLVAVGLLYLIVRMLFEGFRARAQDEPLVPYVPIRWLVIGLIVLAAFRAGYALTEQDVIDVGGASVIGADLITHGDGIYDGGRLTTDLFHGDTYGPVAYLSYVPFELAWPLTGNWLDSAAARLAAVAFDLLTMVGLLTLGRRLRPGDEGRLLGLVLAYAWISYPYTMFALAHSLNDALVAFLLVAALLAVSSPPGRGALLALAAATKFAPGALAPLFAGGVGTPRRRPALIFAVTFLLVLIAVFLPFIPDGGPREIYDRTLGFQSDRGCCGGIIADTSHLDVLLWLKGPARVAALCLAVFLAFRPRIKTVRQLSALSAAVIAALLFGVPNWFPSYVVWLAPFVFIALFDTDTGATARAGREARPSRSPKPVRLPGPRRSA
jgi:hypothetical protein